MEYQKGLWGILRLMVQGSVAALIIAGITALGTAVSLWLSETTAIYDQIYAQNLNLALFDSDPATDTYL